MVSNSAVTPISVLRRALSGEVEATSLRHVSRQVGMSPAALQKLLAGGNPEGAARRRVERWFVLHGPGRLQRGVTAGTALSVLRVMVHDVAPVRHRATLERLVRALEEAYRTARLPEPAWLEEVRAELRGEEAAGA